MIKRQDLKAEYAEESSVIAKLVEGVQASGIFVLGENVAAFEKEFAAFISANHCAGVGSGYDAIYISLMSSNVGSGDEVITTPFTAFPTIAAILARGAKPVFADIDPATFLLDIKQVERLITRKTKAVIPVHLFGNVFDVEKLRTLIPDEIFIIEDACQAHGAIINGKFAGTLGDYGCFSFYPTKNLGGIGDGGAIIAKDKESLELLKQKRMFGMKSKDNFTSVGINSRLDEVQAAVLRYRLDHLNKRNKARRSIAKLYKDNIDTNFYSTQYISEKVRSCYHIFSLILPSKIMRDNLINYLEAHGIQSNIYYPMSHHLQSACGHLKYKVGDFIHSETLSDSIIAIPMNSNLSLEDACFVIDILDKFKKNNVGSLVL